MTDEMRKKVARLPVWAREYIKHLQSLPETLADEATRLLQKVTHQEKVIWDQQARMNAMVDMFRCAAKGGNEVATEVKRIVELWIIDDSE